MVVVKDDTREQKLSSQALANQEMATSLK